MGDEVLTENAHGPDGQVRLRGQAPASEWYEDQHAWFLDDLRQMKRLVPGTPVDPDAGDEVVELEAHGTIEQHGRETA